MGEQLSQISNLSKRSTQTYETWQIALIVLFPSLLAVSLAAYCIYQRILLHRLYEEKKQTHPLLREREFTKMSRLTRSARLDNHELERSIMIQKSLASRTSLASTTYEGGGGGGAKSMRSVPSLAITTTDHDQRPWTATSRGIGSAPPSPLSQVNSFPVADAEPVSPVLSPLLASSREVPARRTPSSGSTRPASRSVGSEGASVAGDAVSSTAESRRSSMPSRPKLVVSEPFSVHQSASGH